MESIAQVSLIVYALLMSAGGLAGFIKGKSKASLIAGIASAIMLGAAYFLTTTDMKTGLLSGVGVTTLLTFVFAMRLVKTKKFMPSGMLLILNSIEEIILLLGAFLKP